MGGPLHTLQCLFLIQNELTESGNIKEKKAKLEITYRGTGDRAVCPEHPSCSDA